VTYSRNKFAVRTYIHTKFKYESQFSIFDSFRDSRVHTNDFLKFMGGLWALEWAWHLALRKKLRNPHANSQYPSSYSFRDLIVHTDRQTGGQTDMSRSTRLVILIKNIYTLWGRNASFWLLHTFLRILNRVYYSTSNVYKKASPYLCSCQMDLFFYKFYINGIIS